MDKENCKVFIIDDDPSVRKSFSFLLRSAGYSVESFNSAEEFLDLEDFNGQGCILLDIFMEGRSGLELQEEIASKFGCLPIIYISGQGDINMSVRALKKGAVNFLQVMKEVGNDIILLDIHMPGMNGCELLEYLSEKEIFYPVIIITAYDEPASRECAKNYGVLAYLRKPIDSEALIDLVRYTVNPV